MMALDHSPRKRARQDKAEATHGENSGDSNLFDEDDDTICSQDYARILASQPYGEPWQQWTPEKVEQQLIEKDIPEDAARKFKGEHLWLIARKMNTYIIMHHKTIKRYQHCGSLH